MLESILLPIGVFLIIFGLIRMLNPGKNVIIGEFDCVRPSREMRVDEGGLYKVSFQGIGYLESSEPISLMVLHNNRKVEVSTYNLRTTLLIGGKKVLKYFYFEIEQPGELKFEIINAQNIRAYKSALLTERAIGKSLSNEDVKLLVHRPLTSRDSNSFLILMIVGIILTIFCTLSLFY